MNELERIAGQLQEVYEGHPWHGPSVRGLLQEVSSAQAAKRPVPAAHSIWELVLHLTSWQRAAAGALSGAAMPALPWRDDWPAVADESEQEWQQAVSALADSHHQLIAAIRQFSPERLDEKVGGRKYSYYFLLHGIVQHAAYHAGQIAILKK